ncbi:Hypothetical_protein [Hexamita inflata]|uniref:Hypothetical_protein n=1 Tax=Hexamita inflata TaxID=28002 RepID=A0AA86NAU3_9EUKA|nr:Hypothetical protein HINF_LOCUS3655 [Hexamita inflata]
MIIWMADTICVNNDQISNVMYVRDFYNVFSFSNALQRLYQFSNVYWLALYITIRLDGQHNNTDSFRLERPSSYRKKGTASAARPQGCGSKTRRRSPRQRWIGRARSNRRQLKTWNISE